MESVKKTVRVVIEKEVEIELMPSMFGDKSVDEYLKEFSSYMWEVESIDDIIKYAARMVAYYGDGNQHDGLGLIGYSDSNYPRVPDVKFKELSDECEEEII